MTNKDNSIAVIMITLNEAHNLKRVFQNIKNWADEIYILDSYSQDETIDLCIDNNIKVIQKKFVNFGDQWNHALNAFDIKSKWPATSKHCLLHPNNYKISTSRI